MNASICTILEPPTQLDGEADIQQDLLDRKADGNVPDPERIATPDNLEAWETEIRPHRIGEKVGRVAKLAQPLEHLAHSYGGPAILIEWLRCYYQHPPVAQWNGVSRTSQ
jgi:hypothetical protein